MIFEYFWLFPFMLFGLPTAVLAVETLAALLARPHAEKSAGTSRPAAGILIPAHNEATIIGETLLALKSHLRSDDRVLVIADNCSDNTAAVVLAAGFEVTERHSDVQKGKGYALAHGILVWADSMPEVVVIMDADCQFEACALDEIVYCAATLQRPAQATYLMRPPVSNSVRDQCSAFAFLFKNYVRPVGLWQLGMPCLLTGTGMAFPARLLDAGKLATGNIVEDMQLGLDLAKAGNSPILVPHAKVWGTLPGQGAAAAIQRTRWEHGHLQTILTQVPSLLWSAFKNYRLEVAVLAIELMVPPLTLFLMLILLSTFLTALICWGQWQHMAMTAALTILTLCIATILTAWLRFGRHVLAPKSLLFVPMYFFWKLPIYLRFAGNRQRSWVKTARDRG